MNSERMEALQRAISMLRDHVQYDDPDDGEISAEREALDLLVSMAKDDDSLVQALRGVLPYAENESQSLSEVEQKDSEDVGASKALAAVETAQAVLARFDNGGTND